MSPTPTVYTRDKLAFNAGPAAFGIAAADASSKLRRKEDFTDPRLSRLHDVRSRGSAQPAPGVQVQAPLHDASAVAGANVLTRADFARDVMRSAVQHVLPGLRASRDHVVGIKLEDLVTELLDLETAFAASNERGLTIDRLLLLASQVPMLTEPGRSRSAKDLEAALDGFQKLVSELRLCVSPPQGQDAPAAARHGLVAAEMLLSMPVLAARLVMRLPGLDANERFTALVAKLEVLDSAFRGRSRYEFNRLHCALANHARIAEYSGIARPGQEAADLERAIEGMTAMADVVLESIAPGNDAAALNALVGIDSELDESIVEVRVACVASFMRAQSGRLPQDGDPDLTDAGLVTRQATDLVNRERELAKARVRLLRAFDRAGVERPIEVVRGLRMDATLVTALQRQLGKRASEFGLVIMGVYLLERDLARCDAGKRMYHDIQHAADESSQLIARYKNAAERLLLEGKFSAAPLALATAGHVRRQEASIRQLAPRLRALSDVADVAAEVVQALGLTGFEERHIRQLERQGLSSAAEANAVLKAVTQGMRGWLDDGGPQKLKEQGHLDLLQTVRQEENGVWLGGQLLDKLCRARINLVVPAAADARRAMLRQASRAAIAHYVAKLPDGVNPDAATICRKLAKWGIAGEDVQAVVLEELAAALCVATLADWARQADVPLQPLSKKHAAASLRDELIKKLSGARPTLRLPPDGDPARAPAARTAVRAAILKELTLLQARMQAAQDERQTRERTAPMPRVPAPPLHLLNRLDFAETVNSVRATLRTWGVEVDEDTVRAELADADAPPQGPAKIAVTASKLARWVSEEQVQSSPPPGVAALDETDKRALLGQRILQLVPGTRGLNIAIVMPPADGGDPHARRVVMRDAVRAATLEWLQHAGPDAQPTAADIGQVLANWWPAAAAAAADEVDLVVRRELGDDGITPAKLEQWERDLVAAESRKAVVDSLANPKIGTRIKASDTKRVKLQSGTVTALSGVNVKTSSATSHEVAFERPVDAFEVNIKQRFELRLGAELTVPLLSYPEAGVTLGPVASKEVAVSMAFHGVSLRYKPGPKQAASVARQMRKLSTGFDGAQPALDFDDLEDVDSILLVREMQGGTEVSAGVQASLQPGGMRSGRFGAGFRARLMGAAGAQFTRSVAKNNKERIEKSEQVNSIAVIASAAVSVNQAEPDDKVSVPLAEISRRDENIVKAKSKVVYSDDGQAVNGTERVAQQFVSGSQSASALVGPEFTRIMEQLKSSHPEAHAAIETLLDGIRANEMLSVASPLDVDKFRQVNALGKGARALDDHRAGSGSIRADEARAKQLRKSAGKILANPDMYNVGRIGNVAVVDTSTATNYLMGIVEHSKSTSGEAIPREVKLYFDEQYQKALLEVASLARREQLYRDRSAGARVRRFFGRQR